MENILSFVICYSYIKLGKNVWFTAGDIFLYGVFSSFDYFSFTS